MKETKIRWANATWNPMVGCSHVSEGCDHCYAEAITLRFGAPAYPNGFEPTYKANKLRIPRNRREPVRYFVNSMSDVHHEAFSVEQIDSVYDVMLDVDRHDYLVLTKRPQRMARYMNGANGWLARRGLGAVPDHIWLGTTIESNRFVFRARHLRTIPAAVRFLSCEPLLTPLPDLNLAGIAWVIVGGESGNGSRNFRGMDHAWARELRDACDRGRIAFYFKQSAATQTEQGVELDGERHEEYPLAHPSVSVRGARRVGRYVDG